MGRLDSSPAVLFVDGRILYTDGKPAQRLVDSLKPRKDSQIMAWESVAIALGLSTFQNELAGRSVVLYSDNAGAESATRKGAAKEWDHAQVIHQVWSMALACGIHLWIERVPSKENISDAPSREDYALMRSLHAEWRAPLVADLFLTAESVECEVAGASAR